MTTTDMSTVTSSQPQPDLGPLSWVMVEIREALARSRTALLEAGGRAPEDQATQLQLARTHLHQAHGALQMVDLDGVGLVTGLAETALERFKSGAVKCSTDNVEAVSRLYQALVEYLEELLAGAPSQPVRLFPYYRAVQEMIGAERIHPADLFFPDLTRTPALPPAAQADGDTDYASCRQRFERALLPYMKSTDAAQQQEHAAGLQGAVTAVADAQQEQKARAFWLAMLGFAELVASGDLSGGLQVKQLFGMINLQIRRLSQGTAAQPDVMLRDALFFIAAAGPEAGSATARALRTAFALDGMVPADYERRRYGQLDTDALARATAAIAQAKHAWTRLAGAEIDPDLDAAFGDALADAAAAADRLNVPALGTLLRQVAAVAHTSVTAGRSEALTQEVTTALRYAEHGLAQIRRLPDDFAANADTIGARLLALVSGDTPPAPVQWQDDMLPSRAAEIKAGLRHVENALDEFYADATKRQPLTDAGPVLHGLQESLATLDQEDALRAARRVSEAVQELAAGNGDPAREARTLEELAQNVSALGFFSDMLAQNPAGARERFAFDAEQGSFRSVPFKKMPDAESIPVLEEALEAPPPASAPEETAPAACEVDGEAEPELLAIFIEEAREELAFVDNALVGRDNSDGAEEHLTLLRRSFDTLKGSARMVALNGFAEAAHAVERVLNTWLAEERPASDALSSLLDAAARELHGWVDELAATGISTRSPDALVAAAARVQQGGDFLLDEDTGGSAQQTNQGDEGLDIPAPLLKIYLSEAGQLVDTLSQDFGEWRQSPRRAVNPASIKAAHTLAGTSGTVGVGVLRELALALESALEALVPPAPHLDPAQHDLLAFTVERMRQMVDSLAQGEMPEEQPALIAALNELRAQLKTTAPAASDDIETHLDELVAGAKGDSATSPAEESPLDQMFRAVYDMISGSVPESEAPAPAPKKPAKKAEPRIDDDIDDLFNAAFDDAFAEPPLNIAGPDSAADSGPDTAPDTEIIELPPAEPAIQAAAPAHFNDELDADLLPVFLEEGADLLPQVGEALRAWQHNPDDHAHPQGLIRLLHTLKGSARMAGAMRLGQHVHEIETHIETMVNAGSATPQAFEELLAHYDHALLLFEQLQQPGVMHGDDAAEVAGLAADIDSLSGDAAATALAAGTAAGNAADTAAEASTVADSTDTAPGAADDLPAATKSPLVRVRADILDRLVNQAGEVSISRSKLENEVATLRSSLGDFSDNLTRLRRQLREIEMQAESQIASRMSVASDREFDPLEFDRFTRLQELTRMMAESVNDAATLHESLNRSVDNASDDLVLQARLTRDLQRDLMRVRMVPFSSISERLFRVARQSAKEVDKRVNLDIRGSAVEIDRSVLERMAAPFEHLLRNAIAHGIETRTGRIEAGKNETGELLVEVTQQGNEVVIEFSDDGGGLDLDRIRAKGLASGLLLQDEEVTDAQVADLIFEPGFTTAEALTELSGRGVGMDVVQSEAQSLGGRVDLLSTPGSGTRFTIRLPLTLAVTQVVLIEAGGRTYALPSILVEQVLQVKDAALAESQRTGAVPIHGHQAALHYLPALLGEAETYPREQRSAPVLMLKNGNERLALQVDEVLGNREVVIKNIGPQLSRMAGIAGATVLGSGNIVLILNPVALVQHLAQQPEARQHYAQAARGGPAGRAALHPDARTVMVVDDSMTVRRVTQRLLEREGYHVLLAKDGVDALEQLHGLGPEQTPDLMLVDIEMPRMDGFDLTRNVRGDARTKAIPIIMITSRSADKHRNYALELGVNAFFGKPFPEPALLETMRELLKPAS